MSKRAWRAAYKANQHGEMKPRIMLAQHRRVVNRKKSAAAFSCRLRCSYNLFWREAAHRPEMRAFLAPKTSQKIGRRSERENVRLLEMK